MLIREGRIFLSVERGQTNVQTAFKSDGNSLQIIEKNHLSFVYGSYIISGMLQRLMADFGIRGKALGWFSSYLSGRSQRVLFEGSTSDSFDLRFGVPQGSCLVPLLFVLKCVISGPGSTHIFLCRPIYLSLVVLRFTGYTISRKLANFCLGTN